MEMTTFPLRTCTLMFTAVFVPKSQKAQIIHQLSYQGSPKQTQRSIHQLKWTHDGKPSRASIQLLKGVSTDVKPWMNPEDILTESRHRHKGADRRKGAYSMTPCTGKAQNRHLKAGGKRCGLGTVTKGAGSFRGNKNMLKL